MLLQSLIKELLSRAGIYRSDGIPGICSAMRRDTEICRRCVIEEQLYVRMADNTAQNDEERVFALHLNDYDFQEEKKNGREWDSV